MCSETGHLTQAGMRRRIVQDLEHALGQVVDGEEVHQIAILSIANHLADRTGAVSEATSRQPHAMASSIDHDRTKG